MSRTLTKLRSNKLSSAVTTNDVSINDVKHKNKFIKYNIIINISYISSVFAFIYYLLLLQQNNNFIILILMIIMML